MDIKRWVSYRLKKINLYDFGLVKLYCFLAGMVAGAYSAIFVKTYV